MIKFILTFIIVTNICSSILYSENNFTLKQKKFIKTLFNNKKYFDVIAETERLLESNNFKNEEKYNFFIMENYFLGKQYRNIIYNLRKRNNTDLNFKEKILLSQSYLKLNFFQDGYNVLKKIKYSFDDNFNYNLLYRKIEPFLNKNDYNIILNEINLAKKYISDKKKINSLHSEINISIHKFKSPGLAGILSAIIPGSGQIYSNRYFDGLITLLGIASTTAASYYFYQQNQKQLFYSLTFFTALFYSGNIYSAYNSADLYNRGISESLKSKIYSNYIPKYNPVNNNPDLLFNNN